MHKKPAYLFPVLLLAILAVVVGCSSVPDSDRQQINFLKPGEEAAMGISEFKKMKGTLKISTNSTYNAQVQKVGQRLSKVMPVPNAEWEFVVFEDPTPNAFALPGGKVGVHTGLFQVTENEAGMAAVMGHEVAHVVARHSGERLSRGALSAGAVAVGTKVINKKTGLNPAIVAAGLGAGATLNHLSHSREQELEADRLGALYMARAGYNPSESVKLWERFAAYRKKSSQADGPPAFLRTHPLDETRIAALQAYLPTALKEYKN
ncbi:MAG: M48 family metallopeptidase [Verrucomicrobiales bacterium]|nr:M48 family metallopeptidase [Verrucomicrobiales bacterium]